MKKHKAESKYKVITIRPYQNNPQIIVSFSLDRHGWLKLKKTKKWKTFLNILGEYQNPEVQMTHLIPKDRQAGPMNSVESIWYRK